MSARTTHRKTHIWLESLDDWGWPGRPAPADVLPPPWVPAIPLRVDYAFAGPGAAAAQTWESRTRARRRVLAVSLAAALFTICCAVALRSSTRIQQLLGVRSATPTLSAPAAPRARASAPAAPLPALAPIRRDGAGSTIAKASFTSAALDGRGAFLVYLPPRYGADPSVRYPVLYLLHGRNGHAAAFLEIGIQHALDRMIVRGQIPPLIAVMIQDRSGLNNWRNIGHRRSASYVVEVQQLIDRMLPTIAARSGRAIAGGSMGGFGAMHVALANPYRFAVVESWLGFFDGLDGELQRDVPVISRLGLHAFLYGAEQDPVAVPEEDLTFAQQLREAGAEAQGAIYPGDHSLQKLSDHLETALLFAARSLSEAARDEAIREARARWHY